MLLHSIFLSVLLKSVHTNTTTPLLTAVYPVWKHTELNAFVSESNRPNWSRCVEINLTPEACCWLIIPLGLLCYSYWLCTLSKQSLKLVLAIRELKLAISFLQIKLIQE